LDPARLNQSQYIYLKLGRLGLGGLAGRNTARLALPPDVPASILPALAETSIDKAMDKLRQTWTGPATAAGEVTAKKSVSLVRKHRHHGRRQVPGREDE
jgi:hypothetical protein